MAAMRTGLACWVVLCLMHAGSASAQQLVSELRLGVLAHDIPVLGSHRESGADINGEVLFVSPVPDNLVAGVSPALRWLLVPRPDIGGDLNTAGGTSQLYLGLVWTATLFGDVLTPGDSVFLDLGIGPAFNNGLISTTDPDRKSLGSHTLFHGSLGLGYRFDRRYSVSLYYEHSSNGGLARENDGLNNAGVRLGLAF